MEAIKDGTHLYEVERRAEHAARPGYAALDVYEEEPVSSDHPLLRMPNVLCTPHLGWAEWDTFEAYFGETFARVAQFAKKSGSDPDF